MQNLPKIFLSLLFLASLYISTAASPNTAGFVNPILRTPNAGCAINNLTHDRFSPEISEEERVKLCQTINKTASKLNSTTWSPALSAELNNIWRVFTSQRVILRPMPKGVSSRTLAMAEPFPSGASHNNFEACIYVRPEKSDSDSFFQVLFHELRHVYDFHEAWTAKTKMNSLELERRAFLLMGKIARETPERENFSGLPKFWKDSWRNLSSQEISLKQQAAIEKYLQKNNLYRNLEQSGHELDFSYLKAAAKPAPAWQIIPAGAKKGGERLPDRQPLPKTGKLLEQKIQELDFNLEKPKNTRDEKEILRVALSNEKKIYYGMSNFVYEQKLQFQCWRKGKSVAVFSENNTITRTQQGNALAESNLPLQAANAPCVLNYQDLKTDFTETFWASPALEKMPITFSGFTEVEGKTLARYTVLQPDSRLYAQLANQYSSIRPFRVFVGTIFVSPEDGQIVKFWGTSYPEENITSNKSRKIVGSYSVTALRQKLNINQGVWVTVYIGTVAVANVGEDSRPFSYTVNFDNYRQSTSDVRIIDEETVAVGTKE